MQIAPIILQRFILRQEMNIYKQNKIAKKTYFVWGTIEASHKTERWVELPKPLRNIICSNCIIVMAQLNDVILHLFSKSFPWSWLFKKKTNQIQLINWFCDWTKCKTLQVRSRCNFKKWIIFRFRDFYLKFLLNIDVIEI